MEIKAKTFKDRIYDNLQGIIITVVVVSAIIGAAWFGHSNNMDMIAKDTKEANEYKRHLISKLQVVESDNKPQLVCNTSQILSPNSYDLIQIKNDYFIVTEETVNTPDKALRLDECEVYTYVTTTMKPKPKIIIPVDKQHELEVNKLTSKIISLQGSVSTYSSQQSKYQDTLDIANQQISDLKELVTNQQKELVRLSLVEAKYKEVKTLLTIVIEKKDIKLKDLVVKEKKPAPVIVEVKKTLKKVEKKLVVNTTITPIETITAAAEEYIKRQIYTIREIPNMHKKADSGKTASHVIRRPSLKDLKGIKLTPAQLENAEHVKTQLNLAINGMVKTYTGRFDIDEIAFRKNIKTIVGI